MKKINPNILAILFAQIVCAGVLAVGNPTEESTLQTLATTVYVFLLLAGITASAYIIFENENKRF